MILHMLYLFFSLSYLIHLPSSLFTLPVHAAEPYVYHMLFILSMPFTTCLPYVLHAFFLPLPCVLLVYKQQGYLGPQKKNNWNTQILVKI